jgi:hypothetical protein
LSLVANSVSCCWPTSNQRPGSQSLGSRRVPGKSAPKLIPGQHNDEAEMGPKSSGALCKGFERSSHSVRALKKSRDISSIVKWGLCCACRLRRSRSAQNEQNDNQLDKEEALLPNGNRNEVDTKHLRLGSVAARGKRKKKASQYSFQGSRKTSKTSGKILLSPSEKHRVNKSKLRRQAKREKWSHRILQQGERKGESVLTFQQRRSREQVDEQVEPQANDGGQFGEQGRDGDDDVNPNDHQPSKVINFSP